MLLPSPLQSRKSKSASNRRTRAKRNSFDELSQRAKHSQKKRKSKMMKQCCRLCGRVRRLWLMSSAESKKRKRNSWQLPLQTQLLMPRPKKKDLKSANATWRLNARSSRSSREPLRPKCTLVSKRSRSV